MLLVWSHLLWIYFLNWWDEVPGEEKWERGSICARALAVHTVLQSGRCIREVCTAAHSQECWEDEGRKVSHSLLGFSTCLFLQFLKFSDVLSAQGTKNCLWSLILCCCRPWENSSGETQQASTEVNAVLTPAQQPAGHMSAESQAESAGPWTWSTDHRSAVTEKSVWRRGKNLFASWDQNKMVSIYLFTSWQDSALILSALKRDQACLLSWCSKTSKEEETRNLLRTRDHFLQPLNFKTARFRKGIWCSWCLLEPQMKRGREKRSCKW